MCGRFSLTKEEEAINERFKLFGSKDPYIPRYNGAPTQNMGVILNSDQKYLAQLKWGLIPSWSKDISVGSKMINARSESVQTKPSFRNAYRQQRCLVPSDGFFEWKRDKSKIPYYISLPNHELYAMAGIWEEWKNPQGVVIKSFSILTCESNSQMAELHHRMPVILNPKDESEWLNNDDVSALNQLLKPFKGKMEIYQVSKQVNSVANDKPELLVKHEDGQISLFDN